MQPAIDAKDALGIKRAAQVVVSMGEGMNMSRNTTSEEYELAPDEVIVTRTDPSSYITYANEAFVRSSGYSLEECVGQPQNLVRHPDMPKEAFADMWRTIKSGQPWTGIVKNRRKSGGFYWVRANVTPIVERGRIVGYMSVRTRPSRAERTAAEALYRDMREGRARHISLRAGEVIDTSLGGRLRSLTHWSVAQTSFIAMSVAVALFVALTVLPGSSQRAAVPFVAGAGAIVCALFGWFQYKNVLAPLASMKAAAIQVLGGDLQSAFPEHGGLEVRQLARLLEQMNAKIVGVLRDANACVQRVVEGAEGIAGGNEDLANRTNASAASLEETAAALEELSATVKLNSTNAGEAKLIVSSATQVAGRASAAVQTLTTSFDGIVTASRKVADIVGVIDSIAFQTNILALNAAVEAARAGDLGRGFAVVASEVRALAQRCAGAATEIKSLVSASTERMESCYGSVEQAGSTMTEVVSSVQRAAQLMTEITDASVEQSTGLEQIQVAMSHLDQTTQQNASLVSDVTTTSTHVLGDARRIAEATAAFDFAS